MPSYICPSCGAPITFQSSFSVYAVCASCGSTVLRTDRDVTLIGKAADLPDEISPLQVGTRFRSDGQAFTLLGRIRMGWEDGAWSEWFADSGARHGWLSEAQGAFGLAFEQPVPDALATDPKLDAVLTLGTERFRVSDIKLATCLGSEGELPFPAPRGRVAIYYDMLDPAGGFAGLEVSDEGRRFYRGAYVAFDELGFTAMRPVEGWTEAKPGQHTAADTGLAKS